jgi:glycosyltransferase involved in cell wall biosynthesis
VDSPLVLVANGEKFNYRELGDADLVVLPCVDDRQRGGEMGGIPVALMEAMAAGKPVISTRLSGIPELIDDGVSGVLVPPGDPAALAAAMAKLLDDRQMRLTLGTAARRVVEARFDLERNTSALLADFLTAMAVAQPHEDRDPRT